MNQRTLEQNIEQLTQSGATIVATYEYNRMQAIVWFDEKGFSVYVQTPNSKSASGVMSKADAMKRFAEFVQHA